MACSSEGTVAHLQGDLTHSGVSSSIINSLAISLHQIASGGEKSFRIDCRKVHAVDLSGLQLLYVWMQCARIRGIEPELVNVPVRLQNGMMRTGLGHCFESMRSKPENPDDMYVDSGLRESQLI